MLPNMRLTDIGYMVTGLAPTTPSSSTPDYVSMKGYERMTAIIICDNATTVTGSAITLKQAQDVAATGEKALSFSRMLANIDTAAAATMVETAVVSDTFTTTAIDAKNSLYVLDIHADDLDVDNNFDCVRVGTGNATAQVLAVIYILHAAKYAGAALDPTVD